MINSIVFWEPTFSPHKVDLIESIAILRPDLKVILVCDQGVTAERMKIGWSIRELRHVEVIQSPSTQEVYGVVDGLGKSAYHVVSGLRNGRTNRHVLKILIRGTHRYALMSEARAGEGFAGRIRWIHSVLSESSVRETVDRVFCIGGKGFEWFRSVFYEEDKLIPFGYFPNVARQHEALPVQGEHVRVGYLGRLTEAKGARIFLDLVKMCSPGLEFHVAGYGDLESEFRVLSDGMGSLKFWGPIKGEEISEFMSNLDLLIVPSVRKDGWAVVVNEALAHGVAVFASENVGAAAIINDRPELGCILANVSAIEIDRLIDFHVDLGLFDTKMRELRTLFANDFLSGPSGATRLLSAIGMGEPCSVLF